MEERMEQLICENITKNYKSKDALDSVNLTLEKGKIYGLIGRNGAGKTTLLSILSAQNPPSEGSVVLETEEGRLSVWENEKALSHICFSRELNVGKNTALSATKVKDYLRTASVYLPYWDQELADELIRKFHLDVKQKIGKLSKGMVSMVTIIGQQGEFHLPGRAGFRPGCGGERAVLSDSSRRIYRNRQDFRGLYAYHGRGGRSL